MLIMNCVIALSMSDCYFDETTDLLCFSVVGNKNDDPDNKVVLTQDAQQFAEQMGIDLFETSAKENVNVEEVNYGLLTFILYD